MRRLILGLLSVTFLACAVAPAAASAAVPAPPPDMRRRLFIDTHWDATPPGFTIDPTRAIAIAKTDPKIEAIHRAHHPLNINVYGGSDSHYEIYFFSHGKLVADQSSAPTASSDRRIPDR